MNDVNELKCPYCDKELSYVTTIDGGIELYSCDCYCKKPLVASREVWRLFREADKKNMMVIPIFEEMTNGDLGMFDGQTYNEMEQIMKKIYNIEEAVADAEKAEGLI